MATTTKGARRQSPPTLARMKLVEAITTPLGFLVLALLIVESFLGTVLLGADLQSSDQIMCVYIGVGLFIFVVLVVAMLVWNRPQNLTFDKDAHLLDRGRIPYGTNQESVKVNELFSSAKREEVVR